MANAVKRVPIPKNGVDYRGKIVLAPMVRSGECPTRLLALKYGADLVWGPEIIDKSLIGSVRSENTLAKTVDFTRYPSNGNKAPQVQEGEGHGASSIFRLHPEREGKQLIYQMGTANPETAVQAGKIIAADVAGIDVNAGCPKPFSTLGGMGAALLKTPDLLCSILRALVKEVGTPFEIGISVKIRLLETPELTESLVRQLCDTGITGLTLHCRTTPMRPREKAIREQLKMVAQVCHEAGVACLMNGDVTSRDEALQLIEEYGVDGAMIATAAETNPSVFRPESEGGKLAWDVLVKEYIETCMEGQNRWGNTKFLLGQMIPGKQAAYKKMMSTRSYTDLVKALEYPDLAEAAEQTDRLLELGAFEKPKLTKAQRKAMAKAAATETEASSAEAKQESERVLPTAGKKRSADAAGLEVSAQDLRPHAPAIHSEAAPAMAV